MLKTPKGEIWRIEMSGGSNYFFVVEVFVKFRGTRLFNQSEKSKGIVDYWIWELGSSFNSSNSWLNLYLLNRGYNIFLLQHYPFVLQGVGSEVNQ
jgi:hypothetical protein